jgi:hypothetical protein
MIFGAFKLLDRWYRSEIINDKFYPVCSVCYEKKEKVVVLEPVKDEYVFVDGELFDYIYKCPACNIRYVRKSPIKIISKEELLSYYYW